MSTEEKNAVQEAMLKIGYTPSECSKCKRNNIPVVDGEVVEIDITGSGEYRKKYYTRVEGVGFSTKIACSTVELEKKKIGEVLGVFEFLRQTAWTRHCNLNHHIDGRIRVYMEDFFPL